MMNGLKIILVLIILVINIFGQSTKVDTVNFIAAGDLNLGHWLENVIKENGFAYPFKYISKDLSASDLVFANLEAPFCEEGEPYPKNFVFKVPSKHVQVLKSGNINLVSLANNHILDFGIDCLRKTISTLKSENIHFAGAGTDYKKAHQPAVFGINNITFAFFSFSMTLPKAFFASDSSGGTAYPHFKILKDSISLYNKKVDHIIVSFHWGEELNPMPKEYQQKYAHMVINYGADLVIGHHPHILQGIEVFKKKIILYSLGNFIFASYSNKAADSILFRLKFTKSEMLLPEIIPINVNNYEVNFRPQLLQGKRRTEILERINTISVDLNKDKQIIDQNGFLIL